MITVCVPQHYCLMQTKSKRECYTSENSSEDDWSRVRDSGAAKILFENKEEGLLRTEEPEPMLLLTWVEEDGNNESRVTFCLVGLAREGSVNEVTEETAIEILEPRTDLFLLLLLPLPPLNTSFLFCSLASRAYPFFCVFILTNEINYLFKAHRPNKKAPLSYLNIFHLPIYGRFWKSIIS